MALATAAVKVCHVLNEAEDRDPERVKHVDSLQPHSKEKVGSEVVWLLETATRTQRNQAEAWRWLWESSRRLAFHLDDVYVCQLLGRCDNHGACGGDAGEGCVFSQGLKG